ncbi:MAG: L-threonine 3-dehydrogenase [Bacteroidetes bacterium]|nr:MAG: L-threonine 3-dehydrogenase [Bacteroidota bacterium]
MKKILIIGAAGQIGSELTMELRKRYGNENIVAAFRKTKPSDEILESGPFETIDATNFEQVEKVVKKYNIDTIYNLAALLSAVAENKPQAAWNVGVNGLVNILEIARENNCAVFTPSSIGAFGSSTPLDNTPQDTIQRPSTMYGVTKVTGELLSDYYFKRFGVDTRSVRYPGIISNVTLPGGGTTDYAVEIYYEAVKNKKFTCPLAKGTFLDMMYMPDAINAAIDLMEADPSKLKHRNSFNVTSMSFDPEIIANAIKKEMPEFVMDYDVDPVKQSIADSWPNNMDDSCAREEWGWNPSFNLETMTKDMLKVIAEKHKNGLI